MIRVNGVERERVDDTIAELVVNLGIEARGVAVARNGEVVSRSLWEATMLCDGDVLEIVTAAAGG